MLTAASQTIGTVPERMTAANRHRPGQWAALRHDRGHTSHALLSPSVSQVVYTGNRALGSRTLFSRLRQWADTSLPHAGGSLAFPLNVNVTSPDGPLLVKRGPWPPHDSLQRHPVYFLHDHFTNSNFSRWFPG